MSPHFGHINQLLAHVAWYERHSTAQTHKKTTNPSHMHLGLIAFQKHDRNTNSCIKYKDFAYATLKELGNGPGDEAMTTGSKMENLNVAQTSI